MTLNYRNKLAWTRNLESGNERRAVATFTPSERERSPIKLVLRLMLKWYILLRNYTTYNSRNLRTTLAIEPRTGRASPASSGLRDKKRPTKMVRPPSQRGKGERRIGWKKKIGFLHWNWSTDIYDNWILCHCSVCPTGFAQKIVCFKKTFYCYTRKNI